MIPGVIAFDSVEASDSRIALASAAAGRKKRWSSPTTSRATCGPTRPMKPIAPTKATGDRGQERDEGEDLEAQPVDAHAERLRAPLAEAQGGHRPGARQHRGQRDRKGDGADGDLVAARRGEAAHHPEHDLLQLRLVRPILDQREEGVAREEQRNADEDHGLGADAAQLGQGEQDERRGEREGERVRGDEERAGSGDQGPAERDREGRADARRG